MLFGFVWEKGEGYAASYFLEFVLLPIRIGVAYAAMYWLLPAILLRKKFIKFAFMFAALLLAGAVLQRFFIFFFYDGNTAFHFRAILNGSDILRSVILINSTALMLLALKILKLYFEERAINQPVHDAAIEVKSDKRYYRLIADDILFLEGLGNYVTYHLKDGRKIISYTSLKKAMGELPDFFIRIHKSYIVNARAVISYDKSSVEIQKERFLPIGNSYSFEFEE